MWVKVAKLDDIEESKVMKVKGPEGEEVALLRSNDDFLAINDDETYDVKIENKEVFIAKKQSCCGGCCCKE